MAAPPKDPPYRREVFKHWLNLAFIGLGAVAALVNPLFGLGALAVELGVLWTVPDLPPVRARLDEKLSAQALTEERAYYLERLFGLAPDPGAQAGWFKRLFVQVDRVELDARLQDRNDPRARDYLEMREIIGKLRELVQLRGVRLSPTDLNRLELVVNGYLRLLFACEPLAQAVDTLDERRLHAELATVREELQDASAAVRPVLLERQRLAQSHLDRLPKLEATLQLFKTRAESLVHQLRHIHGQVLTDPGMDVTSVLDTMIEKQEILTDPIGQLSADQVVRDVLGAARDVPDTLRQRREAQARAPRAGARERS